MNQLCKGAWFNEVVKCYDEGGYHKAHGWTASTGRGGSFPYLVPDGWEYDPEFSDEGGPSGSHGGCPSCIMTLMHLRKPIAHPRVCKDGDVRSAKSCWDGTTIHEEVCTNNEWVASNAVCPDEPVDVPQTDEPVDVPQTDEPSNGLIYTQPTEYEDVGLLSGLDIKPAYIAAAILIMILLFMFGGKR